MKNTHHATSCLVISSLPITQMSYSLHHYSCIHHWFLYLFSCCHLPFMLCMSHLTDLLSYLSTSFGSSVTPGERFWCQFSADFVFHLLYFVTNFLPLSEKSNDNAKGWRVVPILKNVNIIDFEAGWVNIWYQGWTWNTAHNSEDITDEQKHKMLQN